jgi:hypothetical protein
MSVANILKTIIKHKLLITFLVVIVTIVFLLYYGNGDPEAMTRVTIGLAVAVWGSITVFEELRKQTGKPK